MRGVDQLLLSVWWSSVGLFNFPCGGGGTGGGWRGAGGGGDDNIGEEVFSADEFVVGGDVQFVPCRQLFVAQGTDEAAQVEVVLPHLSQKFLRHDCLLAPETLGTEAPENKHKLDAYLEFGSSYTQKSAFSTAQINFQNRIEFQYISKLLRWK